MTFPPEVTIFKATRNTLEVYVLRTMKWLLIITLIAGACVVFWVVFALWTGIYSLYSYPPSKQYPEGVTLLVSREEKEPTFNSPDYRQIKKTDSGQSGGMGFESMPKAKRPPEKRTIIKLPYIDWAYKKSVEPPAAK